MRTYKARRCNPKSSSYHSTHRRNSSNSSRGSNKTKMSDTATSVIDHEVQQWNVRSLNRFPVDLDSPEACEQLSPNPRMAQYAPIPRERRRNTRSPQSDLLSTLMRPRPPRKTAHLEFTFITPRSLTEGICSSPGEETPKPNTPPKISTMQDIENIIQANEDRQKRAKQERMDIGRHSGAPACETQGYLLQLLNSRV